MRHYFLVLSILFIFCANADAQNSIDKLMGEYSTMGNSKYSSIVERDAQSNAISSVYNELKLSNNVSRCLEKFINAFDNEAKQSTSHETSINGNRKSCLLREEKQDQSRVYMLEYNTDKFNFSSDITISLIIKNKKK